MKQAELCIPNISALVVILVAAASSCALPQAATPAPSGAPGLVRPTPSVLHTAAATPAPRPFHAPTATPRPHPPPPHLPPAPPPPLSCRSATCPPLQQLLGGCPHLTPRISSLLSQRAS